MLAKAGLTPDFIEDAGDMICGGLEDAAGSGMERDVEVDTPFGVELGTIDGGEQGFVEIGVADEFAIGTSFDDLMEVDGIDEGLEGESCFGSGVEAEGVGQMDLGDADAGLAKASDGFGGVFVLDGEMTAVVIHAEVGIDAEIAGMIIAEAVEETGGFEGGFEVATRFGFEAKMEVMAGGTGEVFEKDRALVEMLARRTFGPFIQTEALEGNRHGRDRSLRTGIFGQQPGEDLKQASGIGQAVGMGPVGGIDLFLDPGAMEASVRETVDGEDGTMMMTKPALELGKRGGIGEFTGGEIAEAQSDGIGTVGANATLDGKGVSFEGGECFGPGFTPMDIGAVSELNPVGETHERSEPRAGPGWKGRIPGSGHRRKNFCVKNRQFSPPSLTIALRSSDMEVKS
jgi:hypothetical protein